MTYSTILGLLLSAIGLVLYIIQEPDYEKSEFYIAALLGLGIGLLIGGFMGYFQKKRKKIVQPKFEPKKTETFIKEDIKTNDSGLNL